MPVDRSLLPAQSPFDLLDRESARVDALLADLVSGSDDDPRWKGATRCSEWDARALFGHLRHLEDYNHACVNDSVSELLADAGHDFNDFNEEGVKKYADVPVATLLEDWRRLNADYRAQMRDRGDGFVDTSVGKYPSLFQAYYLAVEYSVHGDDFLLGRGDYEGRDAWRAAFARFALNEQDRPVQVTAADPGWSDVTYEDTTYVVSDSDLAEAGAARLGPQSGLPADVLTSLRCFA